MTNVIGAAQWCSNPAMYFSVDYSHSRSGTNVTYTVKVNVWTTTSGAWYNNIISAYIVADGVERGTIDVKGKTSGTIGKDVRSKSLSFTVSKTSGTTSLSVSIIDRGYGSGWSTQITRSGTMGVPAAGSTMGSTSAGTTLSGPTINVTRYDSGFTDNITLSYNGKTITRNGFTSSKLSFSEAERLLIFQAQGAGVTKSWSISGNTYSGNTHLGSYSGSVNITTEALSTVTAANNFNVESSTDYTVNNPCGGTYAVYARVSSYTGSNVYSATGLTGSSTRTVTPTASTIYSSNTSSKTGTIYWRIISYINGTAIGTVDNKTCTYTFIQSLCGPSLTTFNYAITDAGTKAIMGSSGSYYAYTDNTDKSKFIASKTTLNIQLAGSTKQPATISKYYIVVPGQTNTESSSTSGTVVISSKVLTTSGTLYGYIRDSRGFEAPLSFAFTLNDYSLPSFDSATVLRNPMSATNVNQDKYVKISTVVSAPNYMITANKITLAYRYKASTSSTWSSLATLSFTKGTGKVSITNVQLSVVFDKNTQYDFQFAVKDYYGTYVYSEILKIPVSSPLLSKRSKMLGINKIPTRGSLDVSGLIYSDAGIISDAYIKSGSNVEVGTYLVFSNKYSSSNNSCTIQFKKSDGTFDILKVVDGEIFLNGYELLQFEVVDTW